MPEMKEALTCTDCGVVNCKLKDKEFPDFCLTTHLDQEELEEVLEIYKNDEVLSKVAQASAEVEGAFYGKITRVEEVLEFARRIGAHKIGIATCAGLISESRTFAKILKIHGFEVYGVACKVGAVDKREIGIKEPYIMKLGESMCNPIMQAKLLNKAKTDLNVVLGLCVGHDSLFYKYSEALTTTLVTKDRVTCNNPAAPLYLTGSYYKRLLQPEFPKSEKEAL